jgi:hypothetical protein
VRGVRDLMRVHDRRARRVDAAVWHRARVASLAKSPAIERRPFAKARALLKTQVPVN